jgi:hypothetical protein
MKRIFAICAVLLCALPAAASTESDVASLLNELLGKVDDPAMHERFWADDLVYVSAAGLVKTLPELRHLRPPQGKMAGRQLASDARREKPLTGANLLACSRLLAGDHLEPRTTIRACPCGGRTVRSCLRLE